VGSEMCIRDSDEPGLFNWYVDEFASGDPEVQVAMSKLVNEANAQDLLERIRVPVLGLYPSDGQITSSEQEQLLRDGLNSIEFVHLPTSFHMVQLLYPKTCTEALLAFCGRHDGLAIGDRRPIWDDEGCCKKPWTSCGVTRLSVPYVTKIHHSLESTQLEQKVKASRLEIPIWRSYI